MKKFIEKLKNKENLSFEESKDVFEILMNGTASDQEIYDFLFFCTWTTKITIALKDNTSFCHTNYQHVNFR